MTSQAVPGAPLPRALPRLTALRAPAALLVFGYHVVHDTSWVATSALLEVGYVGVSLFFVLSGFVLCWSASAQIRPGPFWMRRFARVYPSHVLLAIGALLIPVTLTGPRTLRGTLANLTLTQSWFFDWDVVFSLNAVSWSLSCEAFFYLCAPFVIRAVRFGSRPRTARMALLAWWIAMSALSCCIALLPESSVALLGTTPDVLGYVNPLLRSGEFALGLWCAAALREAQLPRVPTVMGVLVLVAAYLTVDRLGWGQTLSGLVMAPFFALLLVTAAQADVRADPGVLRHRWLVKAGEVSFAFYLMHELVIVNLAALFPGDLSTLPTIAVLTTAFGLSSVFAVALHQFWELPVQRWILRRALRSR